MENTENTTEVESQRSEARAILKAGPEIPEPAGYTKEAGEKLGAAYNDLADSVIHWPPERIQWLAGRIEALGSQAPETEDPDEPTEADNERQGVDDEAGELIEQIADLLERTDNDFKASMLTTLQKRQERTSMTVDDNDEDETCFDAVVAWLRSQSREAKLTAVLMSVLLSHEHILPGKTIGNDLYREFEAEALASDEGDFDFIAAYTAGMMAIPC